MREIGIDKIQELAQKKADMFYDYMDSTDGYYTSSVERQYRSRMNIPFRVKFDATLEKNLLKRPKNKI